jgi:preprotein translocase subunit SecD
VRVLVTTIMDERSQHRQFEDQFHRQLRARAQAVVHRELPADGFNVEALPDGVDAVRATLTRLGEYERGLLEQLPGTQAVVIEGHTDSIGPEAYNDKLSQRRAQAVRSYLVAQGIDASRLRAEGYGEQRPLPGREGKAAVNRRVQFRGRCTGRPPRTKPHPSVDTGSRRLPCAHIAPPPITRGHGQRPGSAPAGPHRRA